MNELDLLDAPVNSSAHVAERLRLYCEMQAAAKPELSRFSGLDVFDSGRSVDEVDIAGDDIICTTYFTTKPDFRRKDAGPDDIKYIESWYFSVKKLNLSGIVFHDSLSESFIRQYETPGIKFVKCRLGPYSLNDERFIIYYMFFLRHKARRILFTDGADVTVNKDPFSLFEQKGENTLFVGRSKENKIYQSDWNSKELRKLYKRLKERSSFNLSQMAVYNAGIIGGDYCTAMFFLRQMCGLFFRNNQGNNCNMAAMHYVLYHYFYPNCRRGVMGRIYSARGFRVKRMILNHIKARIPSFFFHARISYDDDRTAVSPYIFSGHPLNSRFSHFEKNSTACITHK